METGGLPGVLNENSLRSAIDRPYFGYFESIYEKAAALVESIVGNHGFADGNKRTAVILLGIFTKRSGFVLNTSSEAVSKNMVDLAAGTLTYVELVQWFQSVLYEESR